MKAKNMRLRTAAVVVRLEETQFAELLSALRQCGAKDGRGGARGRKAVSAPRRRGPKNTRMMKVERLAVETYLEVDCHRTIDTCSQTDAFVVWNRPENKSAFDAAANRNDICRGYSDYKALCTGVLYWHEKRRRRQ